MTSTTTTPPPGVAALLTAATATSGSESSVQLLEQLRARKNHQRGGAAKRSTSNASSDKGRQTAAAVLLASPRKVNASQSCAVAAATNAANAAACSLPRVVSASDDAVIVDSLTAATINLQNPLPTASDSDDEDDSSRPDDSPTESSSLDGRPPTFGGGPETQTAGLPAVVSSVGRGGLSGKSSQTSSAGKTYSEPIPRFLEAATSSLDVGSQGPNGLGPPVGRPQSAAAADDPSAAPACAAAVRGVAGAPPSGGAAPTSSTPESGARPAKSKKPRSPSLVWEKLALSLRQTDCKAQVNYYTSNTAVSTTASSEAQAVLQALLEEARKSGKYVQFHPSMEVSISSCADAETADAVRLIHSVLGLRDVFLPGWADIDSMAIFPSVAAETGERSTEPRFFPDRVKPLPPCDAEIVWEQGVATIYWLPPDVIAAPPADVPTYKGKPLLNWDCPVPRVSKFLSALKQVMAAVQHPACKTFAYRRIEYLRGRFGTHKMFNSASELQETVANKHRDFYNVRKVDTHVHHSACMHQKHLLRFIRKKYKTEPNEVVARSTEGHPVTLSEIFDNEVGVAARDASLDLLNVHALGSCFQRFDIFNSKYNPFGQALLREVFLKTDNIMGGRYLAELTQEVENDLVEAKYQFVEWRLSIYGKRRDEWERLARWLKKHSLACQQVRWMIQIPRLYHVYRKLGLVASFGELLRNLFEPLFEAIRNPEAFPDIFEMLLQLSGWDSVDDESVVSKYTSEGGALPLPDDWTEASNPPYSYWAYYVYANIRSLNHFLAARKLRTLPFRPHCGEAGSVSHLASGFLLADAINHGIMLKKAPVLQYLFYLRQIGLAMSPLSNNALFHDIAKNPFAQYFACGLNVSLSTDDPMMFHFTTDPLLEEYSCCAHVWKLSPVDLCELARNSVLQSHFEPQLKRHWVSTEYTKRGAVGNEIAKTNVSNLRVQFREDTLSEELKYLRDVLRIYDIITEISEHPSYTVQSGNTK